MRTFGKHLNNIGSEGKTQEKYRRFPSQPANPVLKDKSNESDKNNVLHDRLVNYEALCCFRSTIQSLSMRQKLFKWAVAQCRLTLELRNETIQHAMRLYDKYYATKGELPNILLQNQLTLISCMFISSKYEQIYPPVLTDFEYVGKYKFGGKEILVKERQILDVISFQLVITVASTWYLILYECKMPEWGILCYPEFPTQLTMKALAQAIRFIEQQKEENNNNLIQTVEQKIQNVLKMAKK